MDTSTAALVSLTHAEQILWFDTASRAISLTHGEKRILSGMLGVTLDGIPKVAWQGKTCVLSWNTATLSLTPLDDGFRVVWEGQSGQALEDTYSLESGGSWTGGGELVRQNWCLETMRWETAPYQVWDNGPTGLGGVLHPVWFTSSGASITADLDQSLIVGLNAPTSCPTDRKWPMGIDMPGQPLLPLPDEDQSGDKLLRLRAEPTNGQTGKLAYTVKGHLNSVAAQRAFIDTLPRPRATPPADMLAKPIWTTWARYKIAINQKEVLRFADDIIANNFPYSVMEIDDKWSFAYGDLFFDPVKFPEPRQMVEQLHEKGFKVTLWVMPFASEESEAFTEGAVRGYWIRGKDGRPGKIRWWQGEGYSLDVTNPAAVAWYLERLRRLQEEVGIDGFKFDAGEPCFLPTDAIAAETILPNDYTHLWVERVASQFAYSEVRSSWNNQGVPILVREWDRYSSWGWDNGLKSIVSAALAFGITGYPFVLPDMVGGNAYGHMLPDKELLVRWAQANALLPAMQFSIAPWDFDEETTDLCRQAVAWHTQVAPLIERLATEATATGLPIVRPISWLAPDDAETYPIGDQFALGDSVLVAPVMEQGARTRTFYLPAGQWRDVLRGDTLEGGRWVHDHPAPLEYLPWFERV